ncbi:MAG: aminoglycoside phosphotransferase family protein [Nitriliruptoraceae bacterium]
MQRLHHDEVPIDAALVRWLVAEQHPRFAHLPIRLLATQGSDNVVFRLGEDLSVRLPRKPSAVAGLRTELEWLPRLAPHLPLPVPVPVARGRPAGGYPFPWAICRWVPGTSPHTSGELDPDDTARRLGGFVRALQAIDSTGAPAAEEHTQRGGSLAASDEVTRAALEEVVGLMSSGRVSRELLDPPAARALWDAAVEAPGWQGEGVWLHRDLYVGNLLATGGRLSGVVDFGGLVAGDPAGNVMAAWHVLPPEHRPTFLRIVDADPATQLRARGWVLSQGLLALPYYLESHDGMVRMAHRAITAALDRPPRTAA